MQEPTTPALEPELELDAPKQGAQVAGKPRIYRPDLDAVRKVLMTLRTEYGLFKTDSIKSAQSMANRLNQLISKVGAIGQQLSGTFSVLGDIETRMETMKTLMIRKDLCTEDEFETTWDGIKGLRIKDSSEKVEPGDFVRVTFTAKDADGKLCGEEKDFPLRVGSGHLIFEDALTGKPVGCDPFIFHFTYPDVFPYNPSLAGRVVRFDVALGRVKTPIVPLENKPKGESDAD